MALMKRKKLDRNLPVELMLVSVTCRNKDDSIVGQASEGELEREEEKSQTIENSPCFVSPETVVGGDRLAKITRQLELLLVTF